MYVVTLSRIHVRAMQMAGRGLCAARKSNLLFQKSLVFPIVKKGVGWEVNLFQETLRKVFLKYCPGLQFLLFHKTRNT
jgi:hypothetical protein